MIADTKRSLVEFVKHDANGKPYIEGHRCGACRCVFFGRRATCSKCFARDRMETFCAPPRGHLYAYTVVYRSFPGVETPFVHAVVDVEGGGALKGTLMGITPDPATIEMGMPIEIYIDDVGRRDSEGNSYVGYFFRPASVGEDLEDGGI